MRLCRDAALRLVDETGGGGVVCIPRRYTTIDDHAFEGCRALTVVVMMLSIVSIGDHAFHGCTALVGVAIPDSVTTIGVHAFHGCSALRDVVIPASVKLIGNHAFCGCTALVGAVIPASVTTIRYRAFMKCSSLRAVVIPASVTTIGPHAFMDCRSLAVMGPPFPFASVYALLMCAARGTRTFNCALAPVPVRQRVASFLRAPAGRLCLPAEVRQIGRRAFAGCSSFKSVRFFAGARVGEGAFEFELDEDDLG